MMTTMTLDALLKGLPPSASTSAESVQTRNAAVGAPVCIVLDDDPTGTQSVANLPVLTAWEPDDLDWALSTGKPAIYVMTNSRSLDPDEARQINLDVVEATYAALAHHPGVRVTFVSRSDSTLRGHFPLEPFTLADAVERHSGDSVDGIIVSPAFPDAGRITVHGIHYAGSIDNGFQPVGETEFAQDATFGFKSSALPQWVEEKTNGDIASNDVIVIDLEMLRTNHVETVRALRSAHHRSVIVCDAVDEQDLRQLALALDDAEAAGSHFIYRVGPPFVRARIGQEIHAPLTPAEIDASRHGAEPTVGGLIVVGSHVALTTRQLDTLRAEQHLKEFELDVAAILDPKRCKEQSRQVSAAIAAALDNGHVVVRTSRHVVTGADGEASLSIARAVSAAVVDVVQTVLRLRRPKFVIAKGGITSSDVASKGLHIRRATVVGPMLPGIVSLWSGENKPNDGIPYIVFAGNVGDESSLALVVEKLSCDVAQTSA